MKKHALTAVLGSFLILGACTSATAETDLKWQHKNNEGRAVNHIAEEVSHIQHTPQEAVDKISTLYEGAVTEVKIDKDDGVYHYEVEIINGEVKYESKVNADDLGIIKLEKSDIVSGGTEGRETRITPKAAFDIAAGEVSGDVSAWELTDEKYDIILESGGGPVKVERNEEDGSPAGSEGMAEGPSNEDGGREHSGAGYEDDEDRMITPREAMDTALHTVGGIVIEWEYDDDDFEYEIELNVDGREVEVEVDSRNGAILDVEYD
ncbi:PepSY domain-containing protein [Lacicoccus alkaliphilus]|uniref:Peptidase propeptide and YPEB domain-containing protein n=1 Tax=Lacicoccus alkaliphilus DSM 16010 TaxID=1123231 RepID=A0A1M7HXD8_9BACL|nr:PepSY domain-containing protein [Salinicoccus alkaliphilus]SHM33130.1 Peptidase propeptide and YPEB domain-containing protein [Salinicoccus alkaliphilus DSM 16010]